MTTHATQITSQGTNGSGVAMWKRLSDRQRRGKLKRWSSNNVSRAMKEQSSTKLTAPWWPPVSYVLNVLVYYGAVELTVKRQQTRSKKQAKYKESARSGFIRRNRLGFHVKIPPRDSISSLTKLVLGLPGCFAYWPLLKNHWQPRRSMSINFYL